MKRLVLRIQNYKSEIFASAIIFVIALFASCFSFIKGEIAAGIISVVVCVIAFAVLIWFISRVGVILDFRRNLLKIKSGKTKAKCAANEISKLEIIFHKTKKDKGFSSVHIKAHLKTDNTIVVRFYPRLIYSILAH